MEVEVVRSAKRRRWVEAQVVRGVLKVSVPGWMSAAEEAKAVAGMVERFATKRASERIDLAERAAVLARRYRLPTPSGISWSDRQQGRWGSCTFATREIRISTRLESVPMWVLDYVIVHELVHLVVADHGREFRTIEARYPKVERATGYLVALSELSGDPVGRRSRPPARLQLEGQAALFE